MCRCFNHISCLSVVAKRISNDISIDAYKIGKIPDVRCHQLNNGLQVTCSIVCTVNKDAYLRVEPGHVWLTPKMLSGEFDVISNVSWVIS